MDEIIGSLENQRGYRMGDRQLKIICYADDAVLVAETENDLQRLLVEFNRSCEKYNMAISKDKTKTMVVAKDPIRCKPVLNNYIIEQVMRIKYLGAEITSQGNTLNEVQEQITKANRISGCLNGTIWYNQFLQKETKVRIYKSVVRPIMTYTAETRPETAKTKKLLEVTEMKTLRKIINKTRRDRVRNEEVRRICDIKPITDWVDHRRTEWDKHISRMEQDRIVRMARDKSPQGRRSIGRPQRRWKDSV